MIWVDWVRFESNQWDKRSLSSKDLNCGDCFLSGNFSLHRFSGCEWAFDGNFTRGFTFSTEAEMSTLFVLVLEESVDENAVR